jgi:hypothetical protein
VKTADDRERRVERFLGKENLLVLDIPPTNESGETLVRIHTSAGSVSTTLRVARPLSGTYAGRAEIDAFGGTRLPFEFELAAAPEDASMAEADEVRLRLPVRQDLVFSPVNPFAGGDTDAVVVEMERQGGQWVANVGYNYDVSQMALLDIDESDRVDRFMRIELSQNPTGEIDGRIVDRFKGLIQLNRADGSYDYPNVAIEADVEALRKGETDLSTNTPVTPTTSASYRPYSATVASCNASVFDACEGIPSDEIVNPGACAGISTVSGFQSASVQERQDCLTKIHSCVESSGTTQSSFVDLWGAAVEAIESGGGGELSEELESFNELIDSCDGPDIDYESADADWETDSSESSCGLDQELVCLRALSANVATDAAKDGVTASEALDVFVSTTSESSFADRMRAFGMDQKIRLRWLLTQDALSEFDDPADEYLRSELEFWEENVVDTYVSVLQSILEPSSLSMLADSAIVSSTGTDSLVALLTELTESWVATAEVLQTSADRWNAVLDQATAREEKARELYSLTTDLYLSAGILSEFNKRAGASSEDDGAGNGANFLNGDFAILRDVTESIEQLSKSYNELIFARDAELVFVTSVDPTAGPLSALSNRRDRANSLVAQADSEVSQVLDEAQARAEQIQNIEGQLDDQIASAFDEMTSICGNRNNCDAEGWLAGSCTVPLSLGECGYSTRKAEDEPRTIEEVIGYSSGGGSSSTAAEALLAIEDASQAVEVAKSDLRAQQSVRDQAEADYRRLSAVVQSWADLRAFGLRGTREVVDEIATRRLEGEREVERFYRERSNALEYDQSIAAEVRRAELAAQLQRNELTQSEYDEKIELLEGVAEETVAATAEWKTFNTGKNGETKQYYESLADAQRLRASAAQTRVEGQFLSSYARSVGELFVTGIGDVTGPARFMANYGASVVNLTYGGRAADQEADAASIQLAAERERAIRRGELQQMDRNTRTLDTLSRLEIERKRAELEAQLDTIGVNMAQYKNQMESLQEEQAARRLESEGEFELSQTQLQNEIQELEADERVRQAEIRAEEERLRDQERLASAQSRILNEASRLEGLNLRLERARFNVKQAISEYASQVSRAESTADRIRRLNRRKNSQLALRKSPAVLFRFANDLRRAERLVEDARRAMMDWLVAIEYYSVRPFVNLRKQTLLASSPAQLADVRNEYREREATCGAGAPTEEVITFSLRDYAFQIEGERTDTVTGELMTPAEQFRSYVDDEYIPVDKTIRYAPNTEIDDFQRRGHDLLTATFTLDVNSFANLRTACNAKIQTVSVNFIGDLGRGLSVDPEYTLVYDGVASLRSCHPDMGELVSQVGADVTSFGPISTFDNSGKAISGIAGVNEFRSTENTLLAERPLGAQYTLIMSKNTETNSRVAWQNLEDIVLRVRYTHQATFSDDSVCR